MSPLLSGSLLLCGLFVLLATGMPIAFALGLVSIIALILSGGFGVMEIIGETFFGGLASFSLVAIPMFILMGAAVASSPAGRDLYEALDRWLNRVPGGLVLSNIGACSIFSALSGSSPGDLRGDRQDGHPGDAQARLSRDHRHRLDRRRRHARHPDPAVGDDDRLRHRDRDLDRPAVPRRPPAGADADRPLHGLDDHLLLARRLQLRADGHPLHAEASGSRSLPRVLPFLSIIVGHPLRALWRRRHAIGGRRRRCPLLHRARRRHLPDVAARAVRRRCSARPSRSR